MSLLRPPSPVTCPRFTAATVAEHRRSSPSGGASPRQLRARLGGEDETDGGNRIRTRRAHGPSLQAKHYPSPSLPAKSASSPPRNRKGLGGSAMASPSASAPQPDRAALLKAFDEARTGVRGLVESGVSSVPDLFVHPEPYASAPLAPPGVSIPVVDLSLPAPVAAAAAAEAARTWGFFHLINHHQALGVPEDYPARALAAVRAFNELPAVERAAHYGRAMPGGVSYSSNVDLFRAPAASWRDTIQISFGPQRPDPARIPAVCRDEAIEWDAHATTVGGALLGLLSEGLGLGSSRLEETSCLEGKVMVCHYYPVCPEPERTMGVVSHTDPGVLTVLAQDAVGGLQVKQTDDDGESYWVDVKPVPGALVINVGDLLQIMSNDKYKSVDHRVIMNTRNEARVSIAIFFNPGKRGDSVFYGPLPELVSSDNPPKYRNFTMPEFLGAFFRRDLSSKALVDNFKL